MRKAKLLHNPSAGAEDNTTEELENAIRSCGYECESASTKGKGWKRLSNDTDFVVISGGDGTVRKVAVKLLSKLAPENRPPVALLPMGTANNIGKSLGISGEAKDIVSRLASAPTKNFDAGVITGLPDRVLMLESFGYGIFPELMRRMKEMPEREEGSPEEKLQTALELLHDIVLGYPAERFKIEVDGTVRRGNFLMAEVMNISSIGPNLVLSPDADPGDNLFEVILIPSRQRKEFARYVRERIGGADKAFRPVVLRGRKISVSTRSMNMHVDDELVDLQRPVKLRIKPEPGMMKFFVPQ